MPKPKSKAAQKSGNKSKRPSKSSQASSGSANSYAVEVIGLLGVGALIYSVFAMLLMQ